MKLNREDLPEGDGAAISSEKSVELTGVSDAEALLFDLRKVKHGVREKLSSLLHSRN